MSSVIRSRLVQRTRKPARILRHVTRERHRRHQDAARAVLARIPIAHRRSKSASSSTLDYDGLEPMVREFLGVWKVDPRTITATCIGVAGAVTDQVARLTNVPWLVDAEAVATDTGAQARRGHQRPRGARLCGTGARADRARGAATGNRPPRRQCGRHRRWNRARRWQCCITSMAGSCRIASEGGHADFAARTPRELELVAELTRVFGRVGVEFVISGPGLVNIYQFTHQTFGTGPTITPNSIAPSRLCAGVGANRRDSDLAGRHLRVRSRGPLPALRRGIRHVRRRPTGPRPGTWRCEPSRPPASTSAAASRRRSCQPSNPGSSSKRSARKNRWRISSPRFRCRSSSILTPASSAPPCVRSR